MKKQITVAISMTLLGTSAWASKARMQALGQDSERGSYYLEDSRNVFKNPAALMRMNNYVVTEWGRAAATQGTSSNPSAEGGLFKSMGSLAYGLYFGSDLGSQNSIRRGGTAYAGSNIRLGDNGVLPRDNELNLFLAGDMGLEWGVRLGLASGLSEAEVADGVKRDNSAMNLGLGVMLGDMDVYANLVLSDTSKGSIFDDGDPSADTDGDADTKWEGSGMEIGGSYPMGDMKLFANYRAEGAKYTARNGASANETTRNTLTLGVAKMKKMSATSMALFDVRFVSQSAEDKDGADGDNNVKTATTKLPITAAVETEANSWLTLRGSVTQNVLINSTETTSGGRTYKKTNANSTGIEGGATLMFGKLKIDGIIGTDSSGTKRGILQTDDLMTRVALHYSF